jgi:FAD/FMN-containing dehydrogenase
VRGGGGNFGVVTSFEFQLHPMQRQVVSGTIMFPIARAREVLSVYAAYAPRAPDELWHECILMQPPGNAPGMVGFSVCYSGPQSGFDAAIAPVRTLGTPAADTLRAVDYVAVQKAGDDTDPRAIAAYIKNSFIASIPPDLISAIVSGFRGHPARMTQTVIVPNGGAIARVPNHATAFAHRPALANLLVIVGWPNGRDSTEHVNWIKQYYATLEPFTGGFYINDLDPSTTAAKINENFGANYNRLVAVKNKYDPRNLFRLNANVKPSLTG